VVSVGAANAQAREDLDFLGIHLVGLAGLVVLALVRVVVGQRLAVFPGLARHRGRSPDATARRFKVKRAS